MEDTVWLTVAQEEYHTSQAKVERNPGPAITTDGLGVKSAQMRANARKK